MARDTSRRDSAGVGPDPMLTGQLTRMKDMRDFKIASGEADIRGWDVRTLSGSEVGKVDDLLIDAHRGEVVMVDIDLKDSNQHVSVPIRTVQIDRTRNCIIVDSGEVRGALDSISGYSDKPAAVVDNSREIDSRAVDARVDAGDEVVVERRPVIEEVVVRRRVVDPDTVSDGDVEGER
jgi:sporulation protein YlmC with PRC-barrel domain